MTHAHISVRFVDHDMFMRYRGGGIGHKYMREIEEKYENMSRERVHGDHRSKPSVPDESGSDGDRSDGIGGGEPETRDGGRFDGDESVDEDYAPSETGNFDDNGGPGDSLEDSDEIESDGGHESYGLAEP